MATCARIQHTLGLQRSILSPLSSRVVVVSTKPTLRFYTSASQQLNNTSNKATAATTTSKFVQNPAFKSTSSLNQSQHSPQFRTQTTQLPSVASRTPFFILAGICGVAFWAGSIAIAANHQRQGTSIVRGTLFNVKFDTKAQELLGDNIDFVNPSWPWISGTVAHLKGRVDIEFQVRGNKAEGRVHFVAVRPAKQWITTDFTLTMPDGTCVVVGENTVLPELSN